MTYPPGTILKRKVPFEKEEDLPYNDIEIIGQSSVQRAIRSSEWAGQLGDDFTIKPISFGGVIDRPYGELQRDYDVVSVPETGPLAPIVIERYVPGPTPEEQFRAIEEANAAAARRGPKVKT